MTWFRLTEGPPVQVQAYKVNFDGTQKVQVTLGSQSALLSEEDAASLGGYLLGVTNNEDTPKDDDDAHSANLTPEGAEN